MQEISLNDGATIKDSIAVSRLLRAAWPDVEDDTERFARYQLLTEAAAKDLVARAWDPTGLPAYGTASEDSPLCLDYALGLVNACRMRGWRKRTAVRVAFFVCEYTKASGRRHAVVAVVLEDGRVIYCEPQNGKWFDRIEDAVSVENFWV